MRYSFAEIVRQSFLRHRGWTPAWRDASPAPGYDIVVVGGGGHGLATAYYLARQWGVRRVAVLERGWIGGGNAGRNTTIIRSNYLLDANIAFYERALRLWEGLEDELNFNVMVSQRGIVNLFHSDPQRDAFARRGNAMRLLGVDARMVGRQELAAMLPMLGHGTARFPIQGALIQDRAGTARHDAVVWGYARAASALGVDIIQGCEVTGFLSDTSGAVCGVETSRGPIRADRVGLAVAGSTSLVAAKADLSLPIESHVLQAFVTEAVKPFLPSVVTFGAGHFYISQSDKGGLVFGGDLDGFGSYASRGSLPVVQRICAEACAMVPALGRARILRSWGGVMDMTPDGSPIIDETGVPGLYLNAGWCYGGFKATPASGALFAELLATGQRPKDIRAFSLSRFDAGMVLDEKGAGARPNLH